MKTNLRERLTSNNVLLDHFAPEFSFKGDHCESVSLLSEETSVRSKRLKQKSPFDEKSKIFIYI